MIGNFGRTAFGGRVGAKRNRKTITISPKGGTIRRVQSIGMSKVAKSIGSAKKS